LSTVAAPGRTGADAVVAGLVAAGAEYVFGNPGTTELAFLDAVGRCAAIEYVTCLHEAVAVGAAEGYARVARRPGVVQLHTAAGLGNAMGMLWNARAGGTPLVVYVGCPSRAAAHAEPILGGDPVALAGPVAKWAWEARTAGELPAVLARAFKVASTPPLGPVVLAVPVDVMAEACGAEPVVPTVVTAALADPDAIREAAARLAAASSPALVIGDGVAVAGAGDEVTAVAELLSAPVYSAYLTETVLPGRHPLDAGALPVFDPDAAVAALRRHDVLLAVGTPFLRLSALPAESPAHGAGLVHIGSDPWELGKNHRSLAIAGDELWALQALAAELERVGRTRQPAAALTPEPEPEGWSADAALAELAAALPEDALVVDESVSAMPSLARRLPRRPGSWFRSRGGALGAGMTLPIGAALAAPGRPVVAVVGDGSAMYTSAALWTAANRTLATTFVVLDNGGYRILDESAGRAGLSPVGTDLTDPPIDFAALAGSLGVAGFRAHDRPGAAEAFRSALAGPPALVHVVLGQPHGGGT
jgi:benzoylformate decarboxylase